MATLQESTNPKDIHFLKTINKLRILRQNFIDKPSRGAYEEFNQLKSDIELYIMGAMGLDPYIKMEAVELLESVADIALMKEIVYRVFNSQ